MELRGKKVLVVGLGLSGVAAARFLHRRGARVGVTDIKPAGELSGALGELDGLPAQLFLGGHPPEPFLESDLIVLSPGVPAAIEPLRKALRSGVPVVSEVELASWFLEDRLIGITGSNGKSTTTALTAFLLQKAGFNALACGNIGSPLVDLVATSSPDRYLAVELSSFQLETINRFRPGIACILNVTPDHMDRYPGIEAYKAAKLRLFANQTPEDHAVVNADEGLAGDVKAATRAALTFFARGRTLENGVCLDGSRIVSMHEGRATALLPASEVNIRGPHNLSNAMAAAAIALLCGAKPEAVASGLRQFRGLEHRLEPVGEIGGVLFVNDSKATNVDAAAVALQSFGAPVIAILGGRDKEGDFTALRPLVRRHVKDVLLIGEAASKIGDALSGCAPVRHCASMDEAVRAGLRSAEKGDVVLLAPGCASFDMYRDFEHRGRDFKRIVRRLKSAER